MSEKKIPPAVKHGLHPRNLHRSRYDFPALIASHPALEAFVRPNPFGELSVDFANPAAVRTLNAALLAHHYGIRDWRIPEGYLCPPIPGRVDYLHHLADLLAESHRGHLPRGAQVRGLDIGTGANAIYPLLGHAVYGWHFAATELDPLAADNAAALFAANARDAGAFDLRRQQHADDILAATVDYDERFDFSLCNPPFHASAAEAAEGSTRKLRNLGREAPGAPRLNFEGLAHELWCSGGEREFIRKMINQSRPLADNILWFSTLVSRQEHLPQILGQIERIGARQWRVLDMAQGQKISRAVAWSFHTPAQAQRWARGRWRA
ncbi:23S rRNA (adenine(1618)-N(6))-methyltransferase RlmF [Uliginosibacterium paludis]|uniref:Ribosomal RNA large subunit methyltransferase F n=1 Tax=Uliginosibacterium paludis TaxID=1615952 RepID=A0ABV2CM91_9RHOO